MKAWVGIFASCVVGGLLVAADNPPTVPAPTLKAQSGPELPIPSAVGNDANSARSKLRAERESLNREREEFFSDSDKDSDPHTGERAILRAKLLELIKKLEDRKIGSTTPPDPGPKSKDPGKDFPSTDIVKPNDALNLAQSLYRTRDFEAAHRAFKLVDTGALARDERAFVRYMTACCLRRLGKLSEAAAVYREITETKDDEFFTECALWQLGSLQWRQQIEADLKELRSRRGAEEK